MKNSNEWLIGWLIAFLGFPLGGVVATVLIGKLETPLEGILGGAAAGVMIGAAQIFALRRRLPIGYEWIVATAVGMGVGLGLSVLLFSADTSLNAVLMRAPVNGLLVGIAQWVVLRKQVRHAQWWIPSVTVFFVIAWFITAQVIGANVDLGFVVFGSSGAILYQLLTGLLLWALLRVTVTDKQIELSPIPG